MHDSGHAGLRLHLVLVKRVLLDVAREAAKMEGLKLDSVRLIGQQRSVVSIAWLRDWIRMVEMKRNVIGSSGVTRFPLPRKESVVKQSNS